jgi:hypothetical protein
MLPRRLRPALLASAVALLLPGMALADAAGHVSFVVGDVSASTPDGHSRYLHKGDAIASGDRISTRTGRTQIRFSDGGLVSLQPASIFGVDDYEFAADQPQHGHLYFNLLRGGMRCKTGSIGHGRRSPYRVKTTLATLRVRGSEFLADYAGDTVRVTAGEGALAVSNDRGSIDLLSGQAAFIAPDAAPMPADISAQSGAAGPEESHAATPPYSAMSGQLLTDNGLPPGVQAPAVVQLQNSVNGTPTYSLIIPGQLNPATTVPAGNGGTAVVSPGAGSVYQNLQASFAARGGALQTAVAVTGPVFDNTASAGALAYDGISNQTILSFGELSAGSSLQGGITAAKNQFIPYIVGVAGPMPAQVGSVSYALAAAGDATPARLYNGETGQASSGTVSKFNITLDLTNLQLGMDLLVQMTGASGSTGVTGAYETKVSGLSVPNVVQNGGFTLSNLATTGPSGGICGSSCVATVSGFVAGSNGSRLGVAYDISTTAGPILGVAALTQTGPVSASSSAPLTSSSNPVFSFATPTGTPALGSDASNYLFAGLSGTFATSSTATGAPAAGALLSLNTSGATPAVLFNNTGSKALQYQSLTTLGNLSYAELNNGSGTLALGGSDSGKTLDVSTFLPYMVGLTGSGPDASLGSVHYSLQAGTTPRLNGTQAGTLDAFSIDLNLSSLKLSANLQVSMSGNTYDVAAVNLPVPSLGQGGSGFMLTELGVSGGGCTASGACSADIGGFLAGQGGTQLGAAYAINVPNTGVIDGVAALAQSPVALAYTSGYSSTSTKVAGAVGAFGDTTAAASGLLGVASGSSTLLQRTAAGTTTADVASDGTLEWGRWISGSPTVDGSATSAALSGNDSVHYVVGQQTSAAALYALASQPGLVSYTLEQHGSTPTNGTTTGSLQSGSLQVNFAAETMQVNLQVGLGAGTYNVNDQGRLTAGSATFSFANLATTGSGGACTGACSTAVSGFFAGTGADKVGLSYAISETGKTPLRGAAGFGKP